MQERLTNDEFFSHLAKLLATCTSNEKSSVFLTQKPLSGPTRAADLPPALVFRATDGKSKKDIKTKIATEVKLDELEKFYVKYAEVMKQSCGALKKRDRKGKKLKLRAKKKEGGVGTPTTLAA